MYVKFIEPSSQDIMPTSESRDTTPSIEWNLKWDHMIAGFRSSETEKHFGDRWGDPEHCDALLQVRERFLVPYVKPGLTVVEIGSGDGRWTQYRLAAKRIIAVDLNAASLTYLRQRFAEHLASFTFYHTTGYELSGQINFVKNGAFCYHGNSIPVNSVMQ